MNNVKSKHSSKLRGKGVSYSCCSCKSENMDVLVNLGMQPVSNKFLKQSHDEEKTFDLILCQCRDCALLQLAEYIPVEYIKPIYSWINYFEPEAHLDDLAAKVLELPGINKGAKLLGLSYKDKTFLERLGKNGNEGGVLDISELSLELIRDNLDNCVESIVKKYGKVDVLVARHILEHSYDLNGFIRAMKGLIKPSGYIIIEVPDFEKSLRNFDYPAIWEEHTAYFTENTLRRAFELHNWIIQTSINYPYPMENCLVLIARNYIGGSESVSVKRNCIEGVNNVEILSDLKLGIMFKESFVNIKESINDFLRYSSTNGIAMMGAGHLGCAFVNYFGIDKYVKFFIDDNPAKKGFYMPGSKLEIVNSSVLKDFSGSCVDTILLSINPRNEGKCIESNKQFVKDGGNFYSIFKNSSIPLPVFLDASDLHLLKKSEEVYYAGDEIVRFSRSHVNFLKSNMHSSKTGRIRICAHKGPGDMLQEMLIMIDKKSYIRPHKHTGKSESFSLIEGSVDIILFDEDGSMVDVIKLGSQGLDREFFYRLSKPQFHTVLIMSDYAIIIETTQGPFNREDTIFAPWSPDEDHLTGEYIEQLKVFSHKNSSKIHDERNSEVNL